jgi:superfamily II DNA/RNA helicase
VPQVQPTRGKRRPALTTFRELGVFPQTADALDALGITEAFPIQEMTLPVALSGADVIGQAKTGTGKTLGFGIPLLQRIIAPDDADEVELVAPDVPQALVVVPTRELCIQVADDLRAAGRTRGVRVLEIYGGRAYEPQIETLHKGVDVVVGTPGRLIDLAQKRHLDLSHVKVLVLDEADEMLDLGFLPDVERIVAQTPQNRQTMLFSATMPGQIINLARRYMRQPTHIRAIMGDDELQTVDTVEQHVYQAHALDKIEVLARILQAEGRGLTLVFCRTKRACDKAAEQLTERGFAAAAVHGDLGQGAREQALRAFRSGKVDVLVATDVAARGIDIEGITHVVNYTCPEDSKTYLHRVGRTARAGASGVAVTFVDWADVSRWGLINKELGLPFAQPVETYSTSEHLYTALHIPATATGSLPRAQRTRAGLDAEQLEDLGETGKHSSRPPRAKHDHNHDHGHDRDHKPKSERPARNRNRKRTRSGQPAGDATEHVATDAVTAAAGETSPAGSGPVTDSDGAARKRRRRRGGRGHGSGPTTADSTPDTASGAE